MCPRYAPTTHEKAKLNLGLQFTVTRARLFWSNVGLNIHCHPPHTRPDLLKRHPLIDTFSAPPAYTPTT